MNAFIHYAPGVSVMHDGEHYVITHLLNLESVLAKNQQSGQIKEIPIKELYPFSEKDKEEPASKIELSLIQTEDWNEAEEWAEKLQPLIDTKQVTVDMVRKIATDLDVHISTVYRKLNALRNIGKVSALVKEKKSGGKGKSRLSPEVELVIQNTISTFYFNKEKQKRSKRSTFNRIKKDLEVSNLEVPAERTIYYRINSILNGNKNKKPISLSEEITIPDRITGANYPLALVQIDHTKLDIIVVDEIYRQSIGRPWITVVIDVFSRMILGFYLSLDPPGNISVGLCLTHAILPKEKWLAKFNITTPYPCWGIMDIVHADNAGEFHGAMLRRACKEYGIDIEWRPVKKPHYGAHIERLLGIVLTKIHELPGTTFSNKEERGEYDSEKYAQMTLSELEEWLALFITGDYHQRFHEALNTTPIKQYERGILGTKDIPPTGFLII